MSMGADPGDGRGADSIRVAVEAAWSAAFGETPEARQLSFWDLGGASLTAANLAYDLGATLGFDADAIEELFLFLFTGPTLDGCTAHVLSAVAQDR